MNTIISNRLSINLDSKVIRVSIFLSQEIDNNREAQSETKLKSEVEDEYFCPET